MSERRDHDPSPRRLSEASASGHVWRSRALSTGVVLVAVALGLRQIAPAIVSAARQMVSAALSRHEVQPTEALASAIAQAAPLLATVLSLIALSGLSAALLQVGPRLSLRARPVITAPRLDTVTVLRSVIAAAVVLAVLGTTLEEVLRGLLRSAGDPPSVRWDSIALEIAVELSLRAGLALLVVGALDALVARWQWLRSLRMTRRELEREHREAHVSPQLERERASMRRELAAPRPAGHDELVVVGDGVALALALRGDDAPIVSSMRRGHAARRLVSHAQSAGAALRDDPALARALLSVPLGGAVPPRLYREVAAAIAASQQGAT